MKIRDGFIVKNIANTNVVVAVGDATKYLNGTITLNDSGLLIWKELENGCEKDRLIELILENYDTDANTAEKDIDAFISTLKKHEIII